MSKTHYSGTTSQTLTENPLVRSCSLSLSAPQPFPTAERTWCGATGSAKVLSQLRRDHDNIRAVLRTLADQLDVLCLAGRSEYLLMLDALDYTSNYPNRFHHPNEARLFDALATRSGRAKSNTQLVLEEHVRLTTLSRALIYQVDQILAEATVNRSCLAACAWEYIALQRQHMTFEEKVIFPMLEEVFAPQDWDYFEHTLAFPSVPFPAREDC